MIDTPYTNHYDVAELPSVPVREVRLWRKRNPLQFGEAAAATRHCKRSVRFDETRRLFRRTSNLKETLINWLAMRSRVRVTIGMLAYYAATLGLLFFGWGFDDLQGFFAQPARVALIALTLLGVAVFLLCFPHVNMFQKGKQVAGRWPIGVFMALMLLLVWFLPFGDRRGLLVIGDSDVPRYIGLGLAIIGDSLRLTGLRALGSQFSSYVTLQENHQLVQTGIYGIIRHPMYLGLLLSMPGFALIFRSWLALPVFVVIAVFVGVRVQQEERLLQQRFGSEFEAYRSRTWRLLPLIY